MSLIFLNGDIWLYLVLGLSVLMVPGGSLVGRAPAAPLPCPVFAGRFSSEGKAGPSGWEGTLNMFNPTSRTQPCQLQVCCQIHARRKTNRDTAFTILR